MAEKYLDISEDPSVASNDANERKLARRLRIQRRIEALKKHEGSEDEGIIEKTQTQKQIETSEELLEKLVAEGDEVVSNVRIANDAREVDRRDQDIDTRNRLLRNLEEEANESLKKYQVINEKWSSILSSKDPLDIHDCLQSQNAKCEEILGQKEMMIEELRKELEIADQKFVDDQKRQSEDINLLIERIENQVNAIAKAYRRELVLIENALNSERTNLLESVSKRWDSLYKQLQEIDDDGITKRKDIMREYEIEMRRVMMEHQEKYRSQKIELETECQNLQLEVQRMKAICMMNIEKLDYSYAVLKRREDENTIVKNQQKRRINKLQDVMNDLKKTYNDLEENTRLEIQKLSDQVAKANKNIAELESKSDHFTKTNEKRYFDIWEMNTRKANELLEKILTADKIIHEQTLGLNWKPPVLTLLKKEDLPSYRKAMLEIEKEKASMEASMKIFEVQKKPTKLEDLNLERKLLNHILRQISDHTGFLIEDRLRELLETHAYHDNIIIRLDNVFQALRITSEEQIDMLLNFFLPYSYCPTCLIEEKTANESEKEESSNEENTARNVCSGDSQSQDKQFGDNEQESIFNVEEDSDSVEYSDVVVAKIDRIESRMESRLECLSYKSPVRNVTCEKGHLLEIESSYVTKALSEFVENNCSNVEVRVQSIKEKLSTNKIPTLSRSLSNEDVANYWKRYRDVFSTKREKLWDGLLMGLEKYHGILKERHRLNNETESLRRQNAELRRLLETYAVKPNDDIFMRGNPRASNKTA